MNSLWIKFVSSAAKTYINSNKFEQTETPKGFTITCHAGAMLTKANSLSSVRTAVEWGADIVEFDVSFRPDGTPVIIHNSNPSDTQGEFLENALEIVAESPSCRINLDIKSTANLAAVDELVKLKGLESRVFYTGVFEDWVDTVKHNSSIPYYLNHKITAEEATDKSAAQAAADKATALGTIGINSNYKTASKLFVDTAHENGLLVSLWTLNKPKEMVKILKLMPDNITTKKPNMLKALCR